MKQLLRYRPLLWLRKIVVYLLLTAIVLGLVVYFAANSPLLIKKVAQRFAPDYNITYSRIHGNVLTGIEIEGLAYNSDPLAKHVIFKWNPNGLLKKQISVNTFQVESANVDTIKTLIASFEGADANESNVSSGSTGSFSFDVKVNYLSITTEPFMEQNITVSRLALKINRLKYSSQSLNTDRIELKADTNVTSMQLLAKVKKNEAKGELRFTPTQALFERYKLPLRKESVGDIVINVTASEKKIVADLDKKMKQLLTGEKDAFNLDIDRLQSHVVYDIPSKKLTADSNVKLGTPYAKDIKVTNHLIMDDRLRYSGKIDVPQIIGVEAKYVKPLQELVVKYKGDTQSLDSNISAHNLQGRFSSSDLKKAALHLENKEALLLNAFIDLPAELNQTKADLTVDLPLEFEENVSLAATVKIDSDLLTMDANVSYLEKLKLDTVIYIPTDSPLYRYNKEVKWKQLSPMHINAVMKEEQIDGQLTAGSLSARATYVLGSKKVDGALSLGTLRTVVSGVADAKIKVDTKIDSMTSLKENIDTVYSMKGIPPIKGSANLSVEISELDKVDILLRSPAILYQADRQTEHLVNDIDIAVTIEEPSIVLQRYTLTYAKQKLFSTKPSIVLMDDTNITIDPLWINDQLQVTGKYDLKAQKGTIIAEAEKLEITHEIVDLQSRVELKTELDGNKTSVNGTIMLLGGNIHYDLSQKTFASDSDIIIVQEIKEKKESPFMENLSTSVQIKTEKPLIYRKGDIDIKAEVDVHVYKAEGSELMVLGSVEILEGGSYRFEGKQFVFDKSYVHFTGNPNKPLIEASVKYQSLNHLITIAVTGTADAPNINFSSKPALSKEQILSIILFDSEGGAGTNTGEDMMKMMGGAMAKSALSNLGVQLDHLVIGEGNSVEVGKKLTDDVVIIYVKDDISRVKLKYIHGKRMESVIGVSEESQSYDIIYKKDF